MREQINARLKTAIKAQDKREMATLRLINAAIKDRDIAARSTGKDHIEESEILELLAKMVKQRHESVKVYSDAGRDELAAQEQEEIVIIESFLPKQMDESEIKDAVQTVISDLNAEGLKDMGRTMGALKEKFAGQMDFGKASAMVKQQLQ